MDDMIDGFVDESDEHITEISNGIIDLEDNPSNRDAMDAIFRSAHTLKGNAGAMGFDQMSNLAHAMEDVLDKIRDEELDVTGDVIDDLFVGLDLWEEMLDEVKDSGEPTVDAADEIEMLRSYITDDAETDADVGGDSVQASNSQADPGETTVTIEDGDVTEAISEIGVSDSDIDGDAYLVRLGCTPDQTDDGLTIIEELEDVFTLHGTVPTQAKVLNGDFGDAFSAIVSTELPEKHLGAAFEDIGTVHDSAVQNVTADVTDESASVTGDAEVDELLSGASSLEEYRESDEEPPEVDLGDLDDGDSGMFNVSDDASDADNPNAGSSDSVDASDSSDDSSDTDDGFELDLDDDMEESDSGIFSDDGESGDLEGDLDLSGGDDSDADDIELGLGDSDDGDADESDSDDSGEFGNRGTAVFESMKDDVEQQSMDEVRKEMEENGHSFKSNDADGVDTDELLEETDSYVSGDDSEDSAESESSGGDALQTVEDNDEDITAEDVNHDNISLDIDFDKSTSSGDAESGIDLEDEFGDVLATSPSDSVDKEDIVNDQGQVIYQTEAEKNPATDLDTLFSDDDSSSVDSTDTDIDFGDVEYGPGLDSFEEILRKEEGDIDTSQSSDDEVDIQSIKVDVSQLDELYTLVQELITNRLRLNQAVDGLDGLIGDLDREGLDGFESESGELLTQTSHEVNQLETITSRIQETVMDIRLVPMEHATQRLPRIARDVARDNDKNIDFNIKGDDVELDRSILSKLGDPLMHLVRNAVDHGVESPDERKKKGKDAEGTVQVRARRNRDYVSVIVEDDGAGINADRVREEAVNRDLFTREQANQLSDEQCFELLFRPGFSTKDEVTETSGRGVGMDVVYTTIQAVDGSIEVHSEPDVGTQVRIQLPVSLAISQMLFIEVGDDEFGIPVKNIDEITGGGDLTNVDGEPVHMHRGDSYPVVQLSDALGASSADDSDGLGAESQLIRIDSSIRQVALECDSITRTKEVVVDPYDGVLSRVTGLSGAVVLGQDNVVNVLDVSTL